MSKISYYTAEGLKKLKEELNQLKDVERPKASNAIAEARDKGDLSENAEYDAAKEAQGMLEMRISKLEEIVVPPSVVSLRETLKLDRSITFWVSTPFSGLSNSAPTFMLPAIVAVTAWATEAAPRVDTKAVAINSSFFIITPFELMNIH